jgi:hypothetical protein
MDDPDEPQAEPVLHGVIDRNRRGQFVKGNPGPPPEAKRKKGQQNLIPRTAKEALQRAVEAIGADGQGRGGAPGFLERGGRDDPSFLAAAYIRACVPPAKDPEPGAGEAVSVTINIASIPAGQFLVDNEKYRLVNAASARLLAEFGPDGQPLPVIERPEPDPPAPPGDETPDEPVLPKRAELDPGVHVSQRRKPTGPW